MDSFLRWWRGGSRGERRTINTTPLPQRYELYHRKRRNEGVSLIAACCIAFNLVMGSGFLALPAAVARCGLVLSPITMGVVCLVMLTSLAWEAEAMARAEALEARVLRGSTNSPSLLSRVRRPSLSDRTFEVCELCRIFCGKRLEMAYAGTFLLYYLATLWAYAVFCFSLLSIVFIWTSDEETYQAAINGLQATYGLVRTSSESFSDAFEVETLVPVEFNATSLLDGWSPDDVIVWESGYVLVGFIWTYHFIYAISIATIGGCVVYYYFVDHDTAGHKDARFSDNQMAIPSIGMLYYVCRFNLGTMAFGSLVLAVVDVVRIFFEFLEAQTNKEDQSSMMAFILKCFRCFLWCFEKSIKGVSTYAYTYVIMQNDGFCGACIHSAGLIYNHFRQIAINAVVQSVLFVMQSVSIPMITTLIAYRRFQGHQDDETGSLSISDPRFLEMETWNVAIPTAMTFVVSFVMARCFAQVYEQIITSLTVCVLHDEHKYGGKYSTNACDGKIRNHYELDGPKFDPRKEKELM